jgi:hypothetical protein
VLRERVCLIWCGLLPTNAEVGGCVLFCGPGVFFTTQSCGMLSAWDLVYKHSEPTLQVGSSHQADDLNFETLRPSRPSGCVPAL